MRLAHIMSRFPLVSETFVILEILRQQRSGLSVYIYPLLRARESVVHAEVAELMSCTRFYPFISMQIVRANWYFIRRQPRAYLKLLGEVLAGTFNSLRFFAGAVAILPRSVFLAYEMKINGITHVHAHFANHPAVAALIINRLTGIPFSFTARGSDIQIDRRMLRQKLEAAAFAVSVCHYNKKLMVGECGSDLQDKIHVVYDGVDVDLLSQCKRCPQGTCALQIVCVARLEEVKGHRYLIQACEALRERGVLFECHFLGDGPLRHKIEKQIALAGLTEQIHLHGACTSKDVRERLAKSDVAVLATMPTICGQREGIPNALKEAMACGLPVVGSFSGGVPELVEDGVSGLLTPPGNVSALADALRRLAENPELRSQMGTAGRKKVIREFDLTVSTRKRTDLYIRHSAVTPRDLPRKQSSSKDNRK